MDTTSDRPEFWQSRYQEKRTPWDLGTVAPPFVTLLQKYKTTLQPGKMAVLGAGYGHDAAFFGQQGFDVVGFDYVDEAVKEATQCYGQWSQFIQADIFSLGSEYTGAFDYVLEHTCFCAIQPHQRPEYVQVVQRLLKPGGHFIGIIWAFVEEDGPPYPSTLEEIQALFKPNFEIELIEIPSNSVEERQEQEILCLFRLKA